MMIGPSDKDYKLTKKIKKGDGKINPEFVGVAEWIKVEYKVEVLNIIHDLIDHREKRPRLTIIFEFQHDGQKFRDGDVGNFDSEKRKIIRENLTSSLITTWRKHQSSSECLGALNPNTTQGIFR